MISRLLQTDNFFKKCIQTDNIPSYYDKSAINFFVRLETLKIKLLNLNIGPVDIFEGNNIQIKVNKYFSRNLMSLHFLKFSVCSNLLIILVEED